VGKQTMAHTKITLTPNILNDKLIIGIQVGEHGRLMSTSVPSVKKVGKTVIKGDSSSASFQLKIEQALYAYVTQPTKVHSVLKTLRTSVRAT
jgi:hypothetical protein